MAKKQKSRKRRSKHEDKTVDWAPTFASDIKPYDLSDNQKKYLLEISGTNKNNVKDQFLHEISIIIGSYMADHKIYERLTPGQVESRIKSLRDDLCTVLKAINKLDDHSRWLFYKEGRGPEWSRATSKKIDEIVYVGQGPDGKPLEEICKGFTFDETTIAISQLHDLTVKVLAGIKNYPKNKRPTDWARQNLVSQVKVALENILCIEVDTKVNGVFSRILREVMKYAEIPTKPGVNPDVRDVRSLVKAVQEIK